MNLRDSILGLRAENMELYKSKAQLENSLSRLARDETILRGLCDEYLERLKFLEENTAHLARVEVQLRKAQDEISSLRNSRSWRLGYALTSPIRAVRRIIGYLRDSK